jgi:drug/metabolite transporter (DMT)-like permease
MQSSCQGVPTLKIRVPVLSAAAFQSIPRLRGVAAAILATAAWGAGDVLTKLSVIEAAPFWVAAVQLACGMLVGTWLIALKFKQIEIDLTTVAGWGLGVLHPGLSNFLGISGLTHLDASVASTVWSIEGGLTLILAWALLGERVTAIQVLLSAASLAAVGAATLNPSYSTSSATGAIALPIILSAVLSCALFAVLLKSLNIAQPSSGLVLLVGQQLVGLILLLGLILISDQRAHFWQLARWPTNLWSLCVSVGILKFLVATGLYVVSLRQLSASHASSFLVLTPVISISLAYLLLHESLSTVQWLGIAVILLSVAAMQIGVASKDNSG